MKPSDFDFNLPIELIAQQASRRGASRLLVLPKNGNIISHTIFRNISQWFKQGDCLVLNNTKVIPARLYALKKPSGIQIELFLHKEIQPAVWEAKAKPARRLKSGMLLNLGNDVVRIEAMPGNGTVHVRFTSSEKARQLIRNFGIAPLPPYIKRAYRSPEGFDAQKDRKRYQTVFAKQDGSVAAPTAGLHFSNLILKQLQEKGVQIIEVTLHVGWGTFMPLSDEEITKTRLHTEYYEISDSAACILNQAKVKGKRIIACGTTAVRAIESATDLTDGSIRAGNAHTDIFIYPGYHWRTVNGLITNFHLPKSSLFILVCALAGTQRIQEVYAEAIREKYRFYSYGDAMLII